MYITFTTTYSLCASCFAKFYRLAYSISTVEVLLILLSVLLLLAFAVFTLILLKMSSTAAVAAVNDSNCESGNLTLTLSSFFLIF